jgi:hypothetical protein
MLVLPRRRSLTHYMPSGKPPRVIAALQSQIDEQRAPTKTVGAFELIAVKRSRLNGRLALINGTGLL